MRFDPSGMLSALDKMEKAVKKESGQMLYEYSDIFEKSLKKDSAFVTPRKEEIEILPAKLGYRIKRKPGVSVSKEISRRIRAIGTFRKGWGTGEIEVLKGYIYRIPYWNRSSNSFVVDAKGGVSYRSKNSTRSKFQKSMETMTSKILSAFK